AIIAFAFLGFFALVVGLIQDYLAHEFQQFDTIVTYLVETIFTKQWSYWMNLFGVITSIIILILLTILISIWIIKKNIDKFLEIRFLLIVIYGGEILQVILKNIFRRLGPASTSVTEIIQYTFPSNQSLMSLVAYGFFAFIIIRHGKKTWIATPIIVVTLLVCICAGLNPLFFQTEYPSDVYAGYIFGGVWLTINIILLEIYRIMPKIQLQLKSIKKSK
ncbi:MAG TPA: phosphatase PAP2 family protein, partial [Clostridium sp.]